MMYKDIIDVHNITATYHFDKYTIEEVLKYCRRVLQSIANDY